MSKLSKLRHHPIVEAWIKEYQAHMPIYPDCTYCGYPHYSGSACNTAPFGFCWFGENRYSVSLLNLEDFLSLRTKERKGFHWKNDIYFARLQDEVVVSFFIDNGYSCPQEKVWRIPINEWQSIVSCTDRVEELEQHNFNLMDQINRLEAQKEHIYASNAALIEQRDAALKLVDEWENYAEKMRSSTLPAPATVTLSATEVVDRIRAIYADQEKKCPICGGGEHRCEACLIEHELP